MRFLRFILVAALLAGCHVKSSSPAPGTDDNAVNPHPNGNGEGFSGGGSGNAYDGDWTSFRIECSAGSETATQVTVANYAFDVSGSFTIEGRILPAGNISGTFSSAGACSAASVDFTGTCVSYTSCSGTFPGGVFTFTR